MEFDIVNASNKLSELDLSFIIDDIRIEVFWYRAMIKEGHWRIDRHKHSTFEFHFVAAGRCRVELDNGEFTAGEGEYYITAPGVYHTQYAFGSESFIEYCINCDLKLENDEQSESFYLLELLRHSQCKNVKDTEGTINLFDKVLYEAYNKKLGFYNNIKSLTALIIGEAARGLGSCNAKNYRVPFKNGKDNYRLEQIKRYIEDNIRDSMSTVSIANFMFLSERQVCRIIKQLTGLSTKEYISSIKLQKAKELLLHSNSNMKEIAEVLGFSSEYYFNQFFKKMDGYPPGVFRSQSKIV
jgi:AraC-like DNA-binding protein